MSKHFVQSALLRSLALAGFRTYARCQVWRSGPRIFVNCLPKAGTHLMGTILARVPGVGPSGRHVGSRHVTRGGQHAPIAEQVLDTAWLERELAAVRPGQYATGHLNYHPEIAALFDRLGFKVIYLTRDLRDMLVSSLYYLSNLRRLRLHERLLAEYPDERARLGALIDGMEWRDDPTAGRDTLEARVMASVGWIGAPGVLHLRFEQLVGEAAGGDEALRRETLAQLLEHLGKDSGPDAVDALVRRVEGRKSATFRKGVIGDWQRHRDLFGDRLEHVNRLNAALNPPDDGRASWHSRTEGP